VKNVGSSFILTGKLAKGARKTFELFMTEKHSDRFSIPNDTDCEGAEILSVNVLKLERRKQLAKFTHRFHLDCLIYY
jgi:hypothetical protein